MSRPEEPTIPATGWRNGLRLRPSAWSGAKHPLPRTVLRTLGQPGDVTPDRFPPAWSLHLGLPDTLGAPEVRVLSNGFELSFARLSDPARVLCLLTPDGLWTGHATLELHPSLFSPEIQVLEQDGATVVEKDGEITALAVQSDGGGTRFCLCIDAPSIAEATDRARRGLTVSLDECWTRESSLRSRFWKGLQGLQVDTRTVHSALETLVYHLEPTAEGGLCSAAGSPADGATNRNALFSVVQSWAAIDPAVATRLLEDTLRRIASDDPAAPFSWPMLLQTCARFEELVPGTGVVAHAMPSLAAYLTATIERADPGHAGTPAWPSAEEGFIPDTHDAKVISASLAAMLLNEIEAFTSLNTAHPIPEYEEPLIDLEHDRLLATLSTSLWNDDDGICHDRYTGGDPLSRVTLSGILPVGVFGLPGHIRDALVRKAEDPSLFAADDGLRLWQHRDTEDSPPPVPAAHQLYLLPALERAGAPTAPLEERCANALSRGFEAHGALPIDLQTGAVDARDPDTPLWFESPLMAACLTLRVIPAAARRESESAAPSYLVALDRHRFSLLIAFVAALIGIVAMSLLSERRRPTDLSEDVVTGQVVATLISQGKYTEAREELQNLKNSAQPSEEIPFIEANLYFHEGRYAEARELYDRCIRDGISAPKAAMNRALTHYRQGNLQEAAAQYQFVIDQFGDAEPQTRKLAETAIRIIRVHGSELTAERTNRSPPAQE